MRLNIKNVMLMVMVSTITACNLTVNTPEEYFDRAALNANQISRFGTYYFEGYQGYIKKVSGTAGLTCEKYLENSILDAEKNLEKVKKLQPTSTTKPMLDASIILHNYVLTSYKQAHLKIAKMIDQHEPEENINKALTELDTKPYDAFIEKYNKLWKLADIYAKDNNIAVEKMPF
jgi:hypothetical protein